MGVSNNFGDKVLGALHDQDYGILGSFIQESAIRVSNLHTPGDGCLVAQGVYNQLYR